MDTNKASGFAHNASKAQKRKCTTLDNKRIKSVLKFLDLEAAGSKDESESDEPDVADFFVENNDHQRPPISAMNSWVRSGLRVSDVASGPIFAFLVPAHTEYSFMAYLFSVSSVRSAFTRKIGSGTVFVETEDGNRMQRDLRSYSGSWRIHRPPKMLDILESISTLKFPPPIELIGKLKRLRKNYDDLLVGDPAFIYSPYSFLAIPRVEYLSNGGPSPQALFNEQKFMTLAASRRLVKRDSLFIVDDGVAVFQSSGLQQVQWDEHRGLDLFCKEAAVLTDTELALFAQADDELMNSSPCQEMLLKFDNDASTVHNHLNGVLRFCNYCQPPFRINVGPGVLVTGWGGDQGSAHRLSSAIALKSVVLRSTFSGLWMRCQWKWAVI
ncbi:hypothetical protein C8R45DRAFT_1083383 [Mycena sanguinolenta]|nr:hypothetical protein C8R45DRAFT_1083383 [Mycena sanguinolenta]